MEMAPRVAPGNIYELRQACRRLGIELPVEEARSTLQGVAQLRLLNLLPVTVDNIHHVPPGWRGAARMLLRLRGRIHGFDYSAEIDALNRLDALDAAGRRTGWYRNPKPFKPWKPACPRGVISLGDWRKKATKH